MKIEIYKSPLLNKLIYMLFYIFIFTIPYDAIRIIPSVYKPVSIIPGVLLFILLIPKFFLYKIPSGLYKLKNDTNIIVLILFMFTIISTLVNDIFIFEKHFINFSNYFITMTLFLVIFLSLNMIFKEIARNHKNDYVFRIFRLFSKAYILPLIIGLIEILSIYGVLPYFFKNFVNLIFGGNQPNRVNGSSFEASWFAMHLIFAFCSMLYMVKKSKSLKYKAFLILSIVEFMVCFSLNGFIVLILASIIFLLPYVFKNINYIIALISLIIFLILGFNFIKTIDTNVYFITRIQNFTSFIDLFHTDLSTFVRVGYPIIGILMFKDHFLFGVGGDNYGYYLGGYIEEHFPFALNFYGSNANEVYETVMQNSGNPKCLYIRYFCEFGLVSGVVFIYLIYKCFFNKKDDNRILIFMKYCILGMALQFDSFCYILLIVFMSFYNNLNQKNSIPIIINNKEKINNEYINYYTG